MFFFQDMLIDPGLVPSGLIPYYRFLIKFPMVVVVLLDASLLTFCR
jgi:hypothetical protein